MYKEILGYRVSDIDELRVFMKRWVQHSKEAKGRSKIDLKHYDQQWNKLVLYIKKVESILDDKPEEDYGEFDFVMKDFVEYIKYVGPLYRYHKKSKKKGYEIDYNGHWVSWSKTKDPKDIYILNSCDELLQIESVATELVYGIDLNRFYEFYNKHFGVDTYYSLGSPAIIKEQEVAFLLNEDYVKKTRIIRNV